MRIFHTAISVNSLEESRAFYEKVFDLKFKTEGARPEVGIKLMHLEDKHGTVIELIEHETPVPTHEDFMDFSNVGFKHIAFEVDKIEPVMEKALKLGAKVIWDIRKGVTVKRVAFITDPNGLAIELVELHK